MGRMMQPRTVNPRRDEASGPRCYIQSPQPRELQRIRNQAQMTTKNPKLQIRIIIEVHYLGQNSPFLPRQSARTSRQQHQVKTNHAPPQQLEKVVVAPSRIPQSRRTKGRKTPTHLLRPLYKRHQKDPSFHRVATRHFYPNHITKPKKKRETLYNNLSVRTMQSRGKWTVRACVPL